MVLPINRQVDGKNAKGYTLNDYRKALTAVADRYNLKVIDGTRLPFNPKDEKDRERYIFDGLHPNEEGHKLYADLLFNQIKTS